ncbi:MAG: glycine--tRNA ligase [Candidatus Bathyarchaeota archaeon]|nr:glycine--tRNA ligase [Candidatus Bathyarchaeota archaeon]MDH5495066.1 glycine--tRNA ligase [Candidatus Bathyarchaeota archaeon]
MQKPDKYEIVSELARRRGFFWPSYEIYGGVSGFYTYGPLGSLLKQRIEAKFRDFFIKPLDILEIESSIVTPAKVFEASGHVKAFQEPMVECSKCKKKFRADHLLQEQTKMSDTQTEKLSLQEIAAEIKKHDIICPECSGELGEPKYFMTMFTTTIGPYSDAVGYCRPEAAQGVFVEFKRLYETARERLPLGVVQIGHALRNEISPRQGLIRQREFTIADIEFFFDPKEPQCPMLKEVEKETLHLIPTVLKRKDAKKAVQVTVKEALQKGYIKTEWQAYFMVLAKHFLNELGIPDDKQRFAEKLEWERAHYSEQGYDQEIYLDRWGWTEVSGFNYRTDYDLKQHMKHSGMDMQVFKEYNKPTITEKVVVEPVLAKIGPAFKKEASKVVALLSKADIEEVEKSLKENGYYTAESFKILPEHVKIVRKDIEETGRRFVPHVVEPSFGIDRLVYVALEYAYDKREDRTLLRLPRELAPVQVGVYPLVTKDGLTEKARRLHKMLLKEGFTVELDEAGSIGRRYARADEVGTPLCVTVDYQTLKDDTITIRDRDSWKQVRTKIENLPKSLHAYFSHKKDFEDIGKSL